nr:histone-lysine N-methyltransferase SETMAR-like [Danaus plexippus plexippus]
MDKPAGGRSVTTNSDRIMENIELDRCVASRDIAQEIGVIHQTILNHLLKAGYKNKLDFWVSHDLTLKNLRDRNHTCDMLLKWNELNPFLKRMVTGDEKWITYGHPKQWPSWDDGQKGFAVCFVDLAGNYPL